MPVNSEEDAKSKVLSYQEAKDIQRQIQQKCHGNISAIIPLYQKYYNQYKDNQKQSQEILINALSRMQNQKLTTQPLNTKEIIELQRNLGILFDRDGTILKINQDAKILQNIEKLLDLLCKNYSLYMSFIAMRAQLPDMDTLKKIRTKYNSATNIDQKIQLLKPIISSLLTARVFLPAQVIHDNTYPEPPILELLEQLQILMSAETLKILEINAILQKLYNYLGVKCSLTTDMKPAVILQEIKFNSPILNIDWEARKYDIHFNKQEPYFKRNTNIPLDTVEQKNKLPETPRETHTGSAEEDAKLIESFQEATKLKEQVEAYSATPQKMINLYRDYHKKYQEHQQNSQKILITALSRIQNKQLTQQPLSNREIIELHRNLGIVFDKDGNILKIKQNNKPLLKNTVQILKQLATDEIIYNQYKQSLGDSLPSQEQLQQLYKEVTEEAKDSQSTIQLITPILSTLLRTTITTPKDFINQNKYPDPTIEIDNVLKNLETAFKVNPLNTHEINKNFQILYNYFGIKCFVTEQIIDGTRRPNITLQKIKFDSPLLPTDWQYKKYNIHFNNQDIYATRTNNIPLDITEKKVLGKGASGKVVRAIGYKQKGSQNNLYKLVVKKIILPEDKETLAQLIEEVKILKTLEEGGTAKRTINKENIYRLDINMLFKLGSPLNREKSNELNFTQQIKLMLSMASKIEKLHSKKIRHNDLKGENVIINYQDLSAELIDYGIAEFVNPDKPPAFGNSKGTPTYWAPETGPLTINLLKKILPDDHQPSLDNYLASDIYSLGKIFICDAGLHTLGIAYEMTDSLYTKRPTISQVLSRLEKYQQSAQEIAKQEENISQIQDLTEKAAAIKELFVQHDICSKEYYNTLIQILKYGTQEQLIIMQQLPIFDHLFKLDSTALQMNLYETQNVPFENKMLKLFKYAQKNPAAKKIAFTLIDSLSKNLEKPEEVWWCNPENIATVLAKNPEVALFVRDSIKDYLREYPQIAKTTRNHLLSIEQSLSIERKGSILSSDSKFSKADQDADSTSETDSSVGESSPDSSPTGSPTSYSSRPSSRRSQRSR